MLPHSGSWGKRRLSSRLVWTPQWDPQPQQENQIFPYITLLALLICTPKDFLSYNMWTTSLRKDLSFFFVFKMCVLRAYFEILISGSVKSVDGFKAANPMLSTESMHSEGLWVHLSAGEAWDRNRLRKTRKYKSFAKTIALCDFDLDCIVVVCFK